MLALLAGTARADSVWTYTGNDMNGNGPSGGLSIVSLAPDCHCSLSGTFTLNTTLTDINNTALSWSFTDGTHTLDQTDSIAKFHAAGPSAGWFISVTSPTVDFLSIFYGSQIETVDSVLVNGSLWAIGESNHGTLVDPVATPEPGTLELVSLVFLFMSGFMFGRGTCRRLA